VKRREFIALLGGATAWALAARAQQGDRVRRIGVLMNYTADDPESMARITVFVQSLHGLGWTVGHNLQIDYRFGAGDVERYRRFASELVSLAPDVLVTSGAVAVEALQRTTRAVPIVFVTVTDPVGGGLVASLARPGGNTTGFTLSEYGVSGKWLELLKQIAPNVTRAAVLRDPVAVGIGQFAAIQAVAPSLQVELSPIDARDAGEIERAVTEFAKRPNGALIVTATAFSTIHRDLISTAQAPSRLFLSSICRQRGPDLLRTRFPRSVPPRCRLCRSYPQRREARRPARTATDEVDNRATHENRQSARPHRATLAACNRRRGDRVKVARERRRTAKNTRRIACP